LQQLLTESVLLALVGAGVAAIASRFLLWLLATGRDDVQIRTVLDWRILLLTIAIAVRPGALVRAHRHYAVHQRNGRRRRRGRGTTGLEVTFLWWRKSRSLCCLCWGTDSNGNATKNTHGGKKETEEERRLDSYPADRITVSSLKR
jgi:hypothetical protein